LDEKGFLAAIRARPTDNDLRLVYADWLEEQGDPRAEFLRLDCQLGGYPPEDGRSTRLRQQLAERFAGLDPDWVATVCHGPIVGCPKADRWCPVKTWEQLQPLELVGIRARDTHQVRKCDACGDEVFLTDQIETVRQVQAFVPVSVAVDPRVVLSPEALQPSEETLRELAQYTEAQFRDLQGYDVAAGLAEAAPEGLVSPNDPEPDDHEVPF
jgi:uncharacterized protein (TIGR02996 family)